MPEEYVRTMRESMLNKCPISSYEQVCEVFKKEVGEMPDQVCSILRSCLHVYNQSFKRLSYDCISLGYRI